jgi:diaminohydroxyphosphoribosylaminopyrimidine deaminase/5-amino-6-(5-phosphoribosylamino)uracil reductase
MSSLTGAYANAYLQAIDLAEQYRGATAPNPCVGAVALNSMGEIISMKAHQKAGTPHAEALVIQDLRERGVLAEAKTLLVTLEPCNHFGRMPPCSEGVIKAHQETGAFKKLIYACKDFNPQVSGQGAERLRNAGIDVYCLEEEAPDSLVVKRAQNLIAPFLHWAKTKRPWVTVKTAVRSTVASNADHPHSAMIPPQGQKTFTSPESLKLAHELRRRADALLTGSGTILADNPLFTVRLVPDHPEGLKKSRWLVVLDRRGRVPAEWIAQAQANGFQVKICRNFEESLDFLGAQGCLEVLVEAGPTLSEMVLKTRMWNEHVRITHLGANQPDRVEILTPIS